MYNVLDATASVGRQIDSRRKGAPGVTFGTCPRDHDSPLRENLREDYAGPGAGSRAGPGAYMGVVKITQSVGRQMLSPRSTMPSYSFGKPSPRRPSTASSTPGPGSFYSEETFGRSFSSMAKNSKGVVFGKAGISRRRSRSKDVPGPGQFILRGSIGPQNLSNFKRIILLALPEVGGQILSRFARRHLGQVHIVRHQHLRSQGEVRVMVLGLRAG